MPKYLLSQSMDVQDVNSVLNTLEYSKEPRKVSYKPYNLRDYNSLNLSPVRLGGLGPSKSKEWEERMSQKLRIANYSKNLRKANTDKSNINKYVNV